MRADLPLPRKESACTRRSKVRGHPCWPADVHFTMVQQQTTPENIDHIENLCTRRQRIGLRDASSTILTVPKICHSHGKRHGLIKYSIYHFLLAFYSNLLLYALSAWFPTPSRISLQIVSLTKVLLSCKFGAMNIVLRYSPDVAAKPNYLANC